MSKHKCAAVGCAKMTSANMLMCREHWFQVPQEIRNRVWRLARSGAIEDQAHHRRAVIDAIKSLLPLKKEPSA